MFLAKIYANNQQMWQDSNIKNRQENNSKL